MHHLVSDPDGRVDLALAVVVWVVAAAVYLAAAQLPPPLFDPVGSAAIPKLVAVVLAFLATLIVVQRVMRGRRGRRETPALASAPAGDADPVATDAPLRPGIAAICVVILAGYTAVMTFRILGFREATVPFVILLGGVLSRFRRSTLLILVPIALALSIGFSWLFSEVLYIDLPVTRWLAP